MSVRVGDSSRRREEICAFECDYYIIIVKEDSEQHGCRSYRGQLTAESPPPPPPLSVYCSYCNNLGLKPELFISRQRLIFLPLFVLVKDGSEHHDRRPYRGQLMVEFSPISVYCSRYNNEGLLMAVLFSNFVQCSYGFEPLMSDTPLFVVAL